VGSDEFFFRRDLEGVTDECSGSLVQNVDDIDELTETSTEPQFRSEILALMR
jgi:hypothetical protein